MMIWKYELLIQDKQTFRMPKGAKILSVQEQNGKLYMWAVVNPKDNTEACSFRIFGTGHPFDLGTTSGFIGTVQCKNGLVWHVFRS
jgi:hypothetical protein